MFWIRMSPKVNRQEDVAVVAPAIRRDVRLAIVPRIDVQDHFRPRKGLEDSRLDVVPHDMGATERHVGMKHDMELDEFRQAGRARAQVVGAADARLGQHDVKYLLPVLIRKLTIQTMISST